MLDAGPVGAAVREMEARKSAASGAAGGFTYSEFYRLLAAVPPIAGVEDANLNNNHSTNSSVSSNEDIRADDKIYQDLVGVTVAPAASRNSAPASTAADDDATAAVRLAPEIQPIAVPSSADTHTGTKNRDVEANGGCWSGPGDVSVPGADNAPATTVVAAAPRVPYEPSPAATLTAPDPPSIEHHHEREPSYVVAVESEVKKADNGGMANSNDGVMTRVGEGGMPIADGGGNDHSGGTVSMARRDEQVGYSTETEACTNRPTPTPSITQTSATEEMPVNTVAFVFEGTEGASSGNPGGLLKTEGLKPAAIATIALAGPGAGPGVGAGLPMASENDARYIDVSPGELLHVAVETRARPAETWVPPAVEHMGRKEQSVKPVSQTSTLGQTGAAATEKVGATTAAAVMKQDLKTIVQAASLGPGSE